MSSQVDDLPATEHSMYALGAGLIRAPNNLVDLATIELWSSFARRRSCEPLLGVGAPLIEAELRAMETTCIAPTRDRSVLGVLVDTAKSIPYYLDAGGWDDTTLPFVEGKLANTPWHCSGRSSDVVWPAEAAPRLLLEKWGGG